jgi:predicted  nucleic acid-binding Zn-ribbon protein
MAKELTVAEKLKLLYELQLIDSQMDEVEVLKGELPMEVRDLEDEIAGLETRLRKLQNGVDDVEGELSRYNMTILESNALIERYKKQMDNVRNNREHDALSKEIELQELEIQLAEKRIREAKQNLEAKQGTLEASQKRLDAKKENLVAKQEELKKIIEKTEKEEEKLKRKSDRARKKIEERLLKAYDKVRKSYRNGLSVVTVSRNSCGGCFNKVPPQQQLELGMRKKIIACEHCGRVLVDDDILMVGKEEPAE